jgi:hypothetical protein
MKRLIFILAALFATAQSQTIQTIGAPTTTVVSRGNFRTDSLFYLPKRQKLPTDSGAVRYQISDSSVYYWSGFQWLKLGVNIDTASMLNPYVRGLGTANYLPKFNASRSIIDSKVYESGTNLLFNTTTPSVGVSGYGTFDLNGSTASLLAFKKGDTARGYIGHNGATMDINNTQAGDIRFYTSSTLRGRFQTDGTFRLNSLTGTGSRIVTADADGVLSATSSATGLVDTTVLSTRAWRQKGDDSLGAIIATKGSGTVTSVATGYGLSGGTITTTGTISADTALLASRLRVGKVVDSLALVKQNVLTNPVTGTGTTNYVPKFTGTSTIGNSLLVTNDSGHIYMNVTPANFNEGISAIQFGYGGAIIGLRSQNPSVVYGMNTYLSTGAYRYLNNGRSLLQIMDSVGSFVWYRANSGNKDSAISYSQSMAILSDGSLVVNTPSLSGSYKAEINGAVKHGTLTINTNGQDRNISNYYASGTAGNNIWIGSGGTNVSGSSNQGSYNLSFGQSALQNLTTGGFNISIGHAALQSLSTSDENVAIGYASMLNVTSGQNTATGSYAMLNSSSAERNSVFGFFGMYENTTGDNNVAIGTRAGYGTGSNANTTGSNNIFIGYESVGTSATESNRTFIGNSNTTSTWVGGELYLGSKNDVGSYILQATGSIYNTADAVFAASSGNVTIGSTSSISKFGVVVNDANGAGARLQNNNNSAYLSLVPMGSTGFSVSGWANSSVIESVPATGGGLVLSAFTGATIFQNDGRQEAARITQSRELLLNTTTDAGDYKLQVSGNAYVTGTTVLAATSGSVGVGGSPSPITGEVHTQVNGTTYASFRTKSTNITGLMRSHEPDGVLYFGTETNHPIGIFANGTVYHRFTTDGKFLVNTVVDNGYRLDVNGTIRSVNDGYFATASGRVGIGTTSPDASAKLDITSTVTGFLPPRMSTTQRDNIASPAGGLIIYNITTAKLQVYTTAWTDLH